MKPITGEVRETKGGLLASVSGIKCQVRCTPGA